MRCKTIETSIFHANGDSLPGPRILVFITWNLDSGFQSLGGSGFLELSSEFQSPLLLIIQTRLHWIQNYLDSGIQISFIRFQRPYRAWGRMITIHIAWHTTSKTILAWAINNFQMQYIVQCSRFKGSLAQGWLKSISEFENYESTCRLIKLTKNTPNIWQAKWITLPNCKIKIQVPAFRVLH